MVDLHTVNGMKYQGSPGVCTARHHGPVTATQNYVWIPATDGAGPQLERSQVRSYPQSGDPTWVQARARPAPDGESGIGSVGTGAYFYLDIPNRSGPECQIVPPS